jgi:CheY-like chemotaxis protein
MKVESRKVLFVDDNPDSTELFEIIALQSDIKPTVCNDSTDALKLLEAEEFDAVILDLSMPVIDGLTLAEEIRQNEQNKPHKKPVCIIFYTARTIDGAIQRVAQRVGVERIYQKGGNKDLNDILMEVKSICGERQMYVHKKAENGKANHTVLVAFLGIVALILTISYFMYQSKLEKDRFDNAIHAEQEKWAKDWSLMKSQRDQIKSNCDDNAKGKDSLEIFIVQKKQEAPAELLSEKPCNYTE